MRSNIPLIIINDKISAILHMVVERLERIQFGHSLRRTSRIHTFIRFMVQLSLYFTIILYDNKIDNNILLDY